MLGTDVYKVAENTDPMLKAALVQEFGLVFSSFGHTSVVTYHPIHDGVMGVGKPVSVTGVQQLLSQFETGDADSQSAWTDQNIIYSDSRYLVFKTNKGLKQPLWFRLSGDKSQFCIDAVLPTMVYVFDRAGSLRMFAAATDNVGSDTQLYVAPLFNTNLSGNFCTGSAVLPNGSLSNQEIKAGVLDAVFNSNFTHSSASNYGFKAAKVSQDHIAIWKALSEKQRAPSSRQLVKFDKTLSDILKS